MGDFDLLVLTTLGDDGSVGRNDHGPLELSFESLNDLLTDLLEGSQGSERNADENVLGQGAVVLLELDLLNGVKEEGLEVDSQVGVGKFELLESLCAFFLELSYFSVALLDDLAAVEHSVCV